MADLPRPSDAAGSPYQWDFHAQFLLEFASLRQKDQFASDAVYAVLRVAAEGGCDHHNCEYPMVISHGLIGELRADVGPTKYRIYFAQPAADMTTLKALKLGSKTHDDEGHWKVQQNEHIKEAVSRFYDGAIDL